MALNFKTHFCTCFFTSGSLVFASSHETTQLLLHGQLEVRLRRALEVRELHSKIADKHWMRLYPLGWAVMMVLLLPQAIGFAWAVSRSVHWLLHLPCLMLVVNSAKMKKLRLRLKVRRFPSFGLGVRRIDKDKSFRWLNRDGCRLFVMFFTAAFGNVDLLQKAWWTGELHHWTSPY